MLTVQGAWSVRSVAGCSPALLGALSPVHSMALLWLFPRRPTFVWRYCIVFTFVIYVLSVGLLLPLTSSTPKVLLDEQSAAALIATEPAVVTRNHSPPPVAVPAAVRQVPPAGEVHAVPVINPAVPVPLPAAGVPAGPVRGGPVVPAVDGRRPVDVVVDAAASPTKPPSPPAASKKPTDLEALHKNMTLHKANMTDLLKHVKAAISNHTDNNNASHSQRKVSTGH